MLEEYVSIPSIGGMLEYCRVTKGKISTKEFTAKIDGKEIEYSLKPIKICPGSFSSTRGIHVYCCEATEENLKIAEKYIKDRLIELAGYDLSYAQYIRHEVEEGAKRIEYYIPFRYFELAAIWLIYLVESRIPDCDFTYAYDSLYIYSPDRAAAPSILTYDCARDPRCFALAWPDVKVCSAECGCHGRVKNKADIFHNGEVPELPDGKKGGKGGC